MPDKYSLILPSSQRILYESWDQLYPPDEWEIKWDNLVKSIQGNNNPYIHP